jgi:tryptophanyl-tRNA synthetase
MYPVLQAADILLYQADLVPVGDDQKQHLELSRDIAIRFNNIYGDVFTVPEPYIPPTGARIMSLQEPDKKMSKSDAGSGNNLIYLLDPPDVVMKKCRRAVTDSENKINYGPEQPGVSNLLTIYACCTNRTINECVIEFENAAGYGVLKNRVGEAVTAMLAPYQQRYLELRSDTAYIDALIKQGAEKAGSLAYETISAVKHAVGFPPTV